MLETKSIIWHLVRKLLSPGEVHTDATFYQWHMLQACCMLQGMLRGVLQGVGEGEASARSFLTCRGRSDALNEHST